MAKIEVNINGKAYPCRPTMGAMLRFKNETGREVTDIDGGFSDLCTYLWCCVASACKKDGVEFNLSLMDFADSIDPEDMAAWSKAMQPEESESGKKTKGQKKSPLR
jgi:hypothetical protein